LSGELRVAALAEPAEEAVGLRADERIALGMGDHGGETGELELVQGLVERGRDGEIGKFDEEVIFLVEGVAGGVVADVLKILKAEVEIATGCEDEAAFEGLLNFIPAFFYQFGKERKGRMGMRGGNDVGNSVGNGHFCHGEREFKGVGAIVEARKYVAMNVNHGWGRIAQGRC